MLRRDQVELIQQEIDGANTPEGSAAVRLLMEQDPEARAMAAELRRVAGLFGQVAEREPPARLKRAILDALPQPARASPGALLRWAARGLRLVTKSMEEPIMTKKAVLIGSAVAAVVIVVAVIITGFPPGSRSAGTIGGVQPAARYHGRAMTEADVTLKNPEIQALFQNDQVLHLVQSDAFHRMMQNEASRRLFASTVFYDLQANPTFRKLNSAGAFEHMQSSTVMDQLQRNAAYNELQKNHAFQTILASYDFQRLAADHAFSQMVASDALHTLVSAQVFQSLAQSQALSEEFMREAARTQN